MLPDATVVMDWGGDLCYGCKVYVSVEDQENHEHPADALAVELQECCPLLVLLARLHAQRVIKHLPCPPFRHELTKPSEARVEKKTHGCEGLGEGVHATR